MNLKNFKLNIRNNLIYLTIPSFEDYDFVIHCFTTRVGGVSKPPYHSLNLGVKTLDDKKDIYLNFMKICDGLDIKINNIVLSDQVHGDNVVRVTREHLSGGNIFDNKIRNADALITNESNIPLFTFYADCVPIFILDPVNKAVGLCHAGWKGTLKEIGKKAINKMMEEYNSNPKEILIGIGPSIGSCCYEVDSIVYHQFRDEFPYYKKVFSQIDKDKYLLNLWEANKISLLEAGINIENITVSGICTKCFKELFFSHRGDNGITGRMAAIIQIKD